MPGSMLGNASKFNTYSCSKEMQYQLLSKETVAQEASETYWLREYKQHLRPGFLAAMCVFILKTKSCMLQYKFIFILSLFYPSDYH